MPAATAAKSNTAAAMAQPRLEGPPYLTASTSPAAASSIPARPPSTAPTRRLMRPIGCCRAAAISQARAP